MHGKVASFVRGTYFIRFPLSLWLILLCLGFLDRYTGLAAFTRGILTPESEPQAGTEAFMVFSVGMIILLLVRIIAVNGDERFETACLDKDGKPAPASWLHQHFGREDMDAALFVAAHFPGYVLLGFVVKNVFDEVAAAPAKTVCFLAALLSGIIVAYIFWLFVGLIYYWTFDAENSKKPVPSEVVFPRSLVPLSGAAILQLQKSDPPLLSDWLAPIFRRIAHLGRGYASPEAPDHLYEGHRLAFIALVGLAVLYFFFFSFTAPVSVPWAAPITNGIACAAIASTLAGCALGSWPDPGVARNVKILAIVLLALLLTGLIVIWFWGISAPRGFSVLGSALILTTGIFWLLSTLAFIFDGTRMPILSSAVFLLLLKGCAYTGEHYFTVVTYANPLPKAPMPFEVLDSRLSAAPTVQSAEYSPLIVITAEGGGIHSAAWTANVLAELEKTFRDEKAPLFHSNILLASGVSGGSVGLLPFLREYTNRQQPFPAPENTSDGSEIDVVHDRLTLAADCSSLQAIAWGLSYYDILKFLSPVPLPVIQGTATENGLPTGMDRSWALERSLARNLSDKGCSDEGATLTGGSKQLQDPYALTLSSAAALLKDERMPAFTFNTTAAETGGRYLLANYELPDAHPVGTLGTDILPAESFLHTFGHDNTGATAPRPKVYADLPLATAARLSATFPYVSSASRVPKQVSTRGWHFIDGGYYDNDGTASALEFLYFAVQCSQVLVAGKAPMRQTPECGANKPGGAEPGLSYSRRLPILLIEIRNDRDIPLRQSPESFVAQNNRKYPAEWGPDHQLVAPLEGFYQAGHASDTFRNRRELCIFEKAFQDRLDIHHVIFDYRNPEDGHQPLSWDLTPNQQKNIACAIDPTKQVCSAYTELKRQEPPGHAIHDLALQAAKWFKYPAQTKDEDETCKTTGLNALPE